MESLTHCDHSSSSSPSCINDMSSESLNMDTSTSTDSNADYPPIHQIMQPQVTQQPNASQPQQRLLAQQREEKKGIPAAVGERQRRVSFQTNDKLETIYIIENTTDDMDTSDSSMSSFTRRMFYDKTNVKYYLNDTDDNNRSRKSFEFADEDESSDDCFSDSDDDESVEKYYSCMEYEDDEQNINLRPIDDVQFHFPLPVIATTTSTANDIDDIITTSELNNKDDESLHSITNESTEVDCDFPDDSIGDSDDEDDDFADDDDLDDVIESVAKLPPMRTYSSFVSNTVPPTMKATKPIVGVTSTPYTHFPSNVSESSRQRPINLTITSGRIRDELDNVSHRTAHQRMSPYLPKGGWISKGFVQKDELNRCS